MRRKFALGALLGLGLVVLLACAMFACSQTPTTVPVRTFERAQRVDTVCLQVYDDLGNALAEPLPLPLDRCSPVSVGADEIFYPNQLFAVVTQSTRGEVAVVNVTASRLVDQKRTIPGVNFLTVGALPTDVASTPDGAMVFVGAAEVNKPAIYGLPTRLLLGDERENEQNTLRSWPVCALPQAPGALSVVPRVGSDDPIGYDLVAVLPGDRLNSAKVVVIDPRPFLRGAAIDVGTAGSSLAPGELSPCPILSAIELGGAALLPSAVLPSTDWGNGIPYAPTADVRCDLPARAAACGPGPCCNAAPVDAGDSDGGEADGGALDAGEVDAGACADSPDASPVPFEVGPLDGPRLVALARRDQILYITDQNVPVIHVVDVSSPTTARELEPLVATNELEPTRVASLGSLAVSPPTRDYQRFLYAVDKADGSLLVYDVTDPASPQRTPLRRPNPELNPFQPPDRIAFASPVATVAFARHDFPLSRRNGVAQPNALSGVLCNPNRNVQGPDSDTDPGYFYRPGSPDQPLDVGPARLRGVFGFVTLASGQVFVIDVDDWDAPCRRPGIMGPVSDSAEDKSALTSFGTPPANTLLIPQTSDGPTDLDPYHAPISALGAVTNELFYPVIAPHRLRSGALLTIAQNRVPTSDNPRVSRKEIPLPLTGTGSERTPKLSPIAFAYEDPQAHIDQRWSLTYEGKLPGFDGIAANVTTADAYGTVTLTQPQGRFCAKGVEDLEQAGVRRAAYEQAVAAEGRAALSPGHSALVDYVQLSEDILPVEDAYWSSSGVDGCEWPNNSTPQERHDVCTSAFGAAGDELPTRDFPILEAYDDRLVLGRFFYPADGPRVVVPSDPSNSKALKQLRCCFHGQVRFGVRTGGTWSVTSTAPDGSPGLGYLHHVTTAEDKRCVQSCDPREALLNGRTFSGYGTSSAAFNRNSVLAARNPMFGVGIQDGVVEPLRDTQYVFTTRGGFLPQAVSVAASTTALSPQSMRFLEPLGQLAIVDAASQGLILVDLNSLTVATGSPYY